MRTLAVLVLFAALVALAPAARTEEKPAPVVLRALEETLEEVIEACEPAVACILVSRSDEYRRFRAAPPNPAAGQLGRFDGAAARAAIPNPKENKALVELVKSLDLDAPDHTPESYGSGIVIDPSGLILTNAHVVRNATKVYVRLPGGKGSYADIHASDPRSDLAVLRLLDPIEGLKPIKLAPPGKYRKGQLVLLLANPFAAGFRDGSPTASWGMVGNIRRRAPGQRSEADQQTVNPPTLHHYGTLLQLDTRITLGCSGGAVLNLKGELIGITTALAALSGVETPGGFAVPFDAGLRRVVEVLKRGEEVEYGFLGVSLRDEPERKKSHVVIRQAIPGSPAQRAGLRDGDRILSINGTPVHDNDDLFLLLGTCLADSQVRIEAQHGTGPPHELTARLAKFRVHGPIMAAQRPPARFGLRVDYSSILAQPGPVPEIPEGVAIREVIPNSPADRARLQPDKLIIRVNNNRVTTPAEFYEAMAKAGRSVQIVLLTPEGREDRVKLESD